MQTEVYRVEDTEGVGIYNANFKSVSARKVQSKLYKAHNPWNSDRPNTQEDFTNNQLKLIKPVKGLHGCPSVETIKEWFDGFLPKFIKCKEIRLVRYKTEKVILGQSRLQCIFEPTGEGEEITGDELDKFIH